MNDAEPLSESLTIRLPPAAFEKLRVSSRESRLSAAELTRAWIMERLGVMPDAPVSPPKNMQSNRATAAREALREQYRPDDVVVLLVAESAPAGGTFFYEANSRLFAATREAFERAFGSMPEGEAFLERFADMGFWIYDMVETPVNRMPGRPRKSLVDAGVTALTAVIGELEPDFVIAVKTSLGGPVQQAVRMAGFPPRRVRVLPFPAYQWREVYVRDLARFLIRDSSRTPTAVLESPVPEAERLTLHDAMCIVLADHPGQMLTARDLANEVAARGLYERRDGGRADQSQVLLRARKYPALFAVGARGISLREVA
jgi:hypothetical protein